MLNCLISITYYYNTCHGAEWNSQRPIISVDKLLLILETTGIMQANHEGVLCIFPNKNKTIILNKVDKMLKVKTQFLAWKQEIHKMSFAF